MGNLRVDELKRIAQEAAGWFWYAGVHPKDNKTWCVLASPKPPKTGEPIQAMPLLASLGGGTANVDFVSTFNPSKVLELLAEIDAKDKEIAELNQKLVNIAFEKEMEHVEKLNFQTLEELREAKLDIAELREALEIEERGHQDTTELFKKAEKRAYELEEALSAYVIRHEVECDWCCAKDPDSCSLGAKHSKLGEK